MRQYLDNCIQALPPGATPGLLLSSWGRWVWSHCPIGAGDDMGSNGAGSVACALFDELHF
jgi:hypothetical protein